ncbi:hypothetical protein JNW91_16790 [Micromonospora sp. STR1_7]|uniref:Uncharacterized protein n=1 Tax=Micromonospora parastrephiae TaxID=2806101 RepID=A0ABS1XVS8_9ACTN|nr:hypothetical protein [Micromonospora parastrephiae]MBM0233366.1 hypothetical protein [Micromonospora parastrephiae]
MTPDEHSSAGDPLAVAGLAAGELRQVLDALCRIDQLLRPMVHRAEELAGRPRIDDADLAQLLDDLRYARTLLTGGLIT